MKLHKSIAAQIVELIQAEGLGVGSHLPAQMLADRLRVSRSPVNEALQQLHEKGVLTRKRNCGYFVAQSVQNGADDVAASLGLEANDVLTTVYFQIAEDLLRGDLPLTFTEAQMLVRYGLTAGQLSAVLNRIANEGWVEQRQGYGWEFSSMMRTPDTLLQSYRLRLALEPAALLEPGFCLDSAVLARCRQAELHLLNGGIETDTAVQLHDRGVRFHESLVEASGNPFFIDTLRRVNRIRRLLSYRSMRDRKRYKEHCEQHLHVLDLLERGRNEDASGAMREHLLDTLNNIENIKDILEPSARDGTVPQTNTARSIGTDDTSARFRCKRPRGSRAMA